LSKDINRTFVDNRIGNARELRIDTQYFVDPNIPNEACERLIESAANLVSELVRSHTRLTSRRIEAIRKRFSQEATPARL
jgi:hypothetical protein